MKFPTSKIFSALSLILFFLTALPMVSYADRPERRPGASPRVNSKVRTQDRGNINRPSTRPASRPEANRPNVNRPNVNRPDVNVNRPDVNVNRPNVNINRPNINVNRPNVNINNGGWRGGGWYGGGYRTPPGWGIGTFAAGLVIGAAISSPPPYYSTVAVGGSNYIYSDGVFLQPRGSSYVVIAPPIDAVVPSLPDGCSATNVSGVIYYDCSGISYQPFYQGSSLVYRVVRY
jgi:hypothetical protein